MRKCFLMTLVFCALLSGRVMAEPALQLYVEGSTYNTSTETWTINSTIGDAIRLWVIGNNTNPSNVHLYLASPTADGLTFTIQADRIGGTGAYTTSGGLSPFSDSGLPAAPILGPTGTGTPTGLPSHGVYGPGVTWHEVLLGNFSADNVHIADFSGTSPINPGPHFGTIYAYDITFTGGSNGGNPIPINIDGSFAPFHADDKAPFSHTARGQFGGPGGVSPHSIPEPSTMAIAVLGSLGFLGYSLRRRKVK
jgi:hypothetical protein